MLLIETAPRRKKPRQGGKYGGANQRAKEPRPPLFASQHFLAAAEVKGKSECYLTIFTFLCGLAQAQILTGRADEARKRQLFSFNRDCRCYIFRQQKFVFSQGPGKDRFHHGKRDKPNVSHMEVWTNTGVGRIGSSGEGFPRRTPGPKIGGKKFRMPAKRQETLPGNGVQVPNFTRETEVLLHDGIGRWVFICLFEKSGCLE